MGPGHHLLITDLGPLDVLGVVGTREDPRSYQDLLREAEKFDIGSMSFHAQSLESLIELKRILGREKDLAVLPLLENTLKEKSKG